MKKTLIKILLCSCLFATACKNKNKEENSVSRDSVNTTAPAAPVEISSDQALRQGVADATRDHPGVSASVNNGEITLTGTIKRDKLTGLMQSLQSLHPQKVNNNLTVEP